MTQARVLYEDGRPYTVPDSLEELTGLDVTDNASPQALIKWAPPTGSMAAPHA